MIAVPGVLTPDEGEASMTIAERAKDFLSEERSKIKLHDLVSQKIREVLSATAEDYFSVQGRWSPEEFLDRLQRYESITTELLQIQSLLGFWSESYHHHFTLAPKRLVVRLKIEGGLTAWLSFLAILSTPSAPVLRRHRRCGLQEIHQFAGANAHNHSRSGEPTAA